MASKGAPAAGKAAAVPLTPLQTAIIKGCVPARYVLAVLGGIGFAIIYGLKVNLSVAIVAMVKETSAASAGNATGGNHSGMGSADPTLMPGECEAPPKVEGAVAEQEGPFDWPGPLQGIILGSYFWGYMISQIPGGRVAEMFSAKWVMFFAVFINVLGTILTPPAAYLHYSALLVMRVLEGIGGGVTFPAMHVMLAKWAPPQERFVISSIVYAGTALGTVISMVMAGALASVLGWESIFYVMGGLSLVWCALWVWLVQDSPQKQKYITAEEREFIQNSLGQTEESELAEHKVPAVPWGKVFTSPPFLAILVAHMCSNAGWYLLLTQLPTYMKTILKFPIKENAGLSAMPFLLHWIFSMVFSKILDICRGKNYISITAARKLGTIIASATPAVALIGVGFVGCDRAMAVTLMAVGITSVGAMYSGYLSNHIDIAPNYAGTLMGITNTLASIPGFLVPLFVGYVTKGNQTVGQWRIVFYTTAVLYTIELIVFTIFASGVEQEWNKPKEEENLTAEKESLQPNKTQDDASEEAEKLSPNDIKLESK